MHRTRRGARRHRHRLKGQRDGGGEREGQREREGGRGKAIREENVSETAVREMQLSVGNVDLVRLSLWATEDRTGPCAHPTCSCEASEDRAVHGQAQRQGSDETLAARREVTS